MNQDDQFAGPRPGGGRGAPLPEGALGPPDGALGAGALAVVVVTTVGFKASEVGIGDTGALGLGAGPRPGGPLAAGGLGAFPLPVGAAGGPLPLGAGGPLPIGAGGGVAFTSDT